MAVIPRRPKKPRSKDRVKREREKQMRLEKVIERNAQHDHLVQGNWVTVTSNDRRVHSIVSGGLPSLGKKI